MRAIVDDKKIQILDDEKFLISVENDCSLSATNRIENNKQIPALIEDDKKFSDFFVIIVIRASSLRSL
jgi:hypothetical protein